jgi:hypothetical protein
LQNRLKNLATPLVWCFFLLIVGVLAVYFKIPGSSTNFLVEPLRWLVAAAISLALIAGVVGVPISAVMWIVNFNHLKTVMRTGVVPAKRIDESFMGEGQRIIEAYMPGRREQLGKVWGEFSLPEHKALDQIEATLEEKEKLTSPICKKDIVAVGKTITEMEKQIPSQWKSLWEQRIKNQQENGEP